MTERIVKANGIEIWTEDFGSANDPTLLLVMGASAQGTAWPDEFCQKFVDGGRHVIRYDNRDTGQSTCFDFEKQPYGLSDLARDAVGVLDAYGVERAHAAGASMGGMICQTLAVEHPDRLHTITSIMSSPGAGSAARAIAGEEVPEDLPGPTPELMKYMLEMQANPPQTRGERVESRVQMFKVLSGSLEEYDEAEARVRFAEEIDRARDIDAANNHGPAIQGSPERREALTKVTTPTLVIHGTEDPILPYEHGVATAKLIPGAELVTIEKMGHDLPRGAWPTITQAILEHTS